MRTLIDHLIYDTDTAEKIATDYSEGYEASLYRTRRGKWFLYEDATSQWDPARITPLPGGSGKACDWLVKHGQLQALEEHFGEFVKENFEEA